MPVLPISFFSNYYLVEINFESFFNSLGINYSGPSGVARFIASKFDIKEDNGASPKPMIQGKPGIMIQDVPTPFFTYTIEAPLIINGYGPSGFTNFLPFNSLNYFALKFANWQWQQLHGYTTSDIQSVDINVVIEEFGINVNENGVTQKLVLKSNALLGENLGFDNGSNLGLQIAAFTISQLAVIDPAGYIDVSHFIGRTAKNYDMFTDMQVQFDSEPPYYLSTGTSVNPSNIYFKAMDFAIKFMIEPRYFINLGNVVAFLIKDYTLSQDYDIVGIEEATFVDNFVPGQFYETLTEHSLYLASLLLLKYQAPMIVSAKQDTLAAEQLVSGNFTFSMYGANYSPGISPYALYDLFRADIA
jgi:hypothetical protein